MTLEKNLALGNAAINAVKELNFKSSNRKKKNGLEQEEADKLGGEANALWGSLYAQALDRVGTEEEPDGIRKLAIPCRTACIKRFANCEARAGLALIFCSKKSEIRPLEIISLQNADHSFLLIGRTGAFDRLGQWNSEAVICDAWAETCYPASALVAQLAQDPVREVAQGHTGFIQDYMLKEKKDEKLEPYMDSEELEKLREKWS